MKNATGSSNKESKCQLNGNKQIGAQIGAPVGTQIRTQIGTKNIYI